MAIRHLITVIDRDLDAAHWVVYGDDFAQPERMCEAYARKHVKGGFRSALGMDLDNGVILNCGRREFADDTALADFERVYADSSWLVTISLGQGDNLNTKIEGRDGCGELVFFRKYSRDLAWLEQYGADTSHAAASHMEDA